MGCVPLPISTLLSKHVCICESNSSHRQTLAGGFATDVVNKRVLRRNKTTAR